MKNILSLLLLLVLVLPVTAQSSVKLKGAIGKYDIEMELWLEKELDFYVGGKYNYAGKTNFLTLQGTFLGGDILQLTEFYQGKETGDFYLQLSDEGRWEGKWIGNSAHFETEMVVVAGSMEDLITDDLSKNAGDLNDSKTGAYESRTYFINDMWFTEDNPQIEIGENGGDVLVEEMNEDRVHVQFDLICGPTYHIASFDGIATKISENKYEFNAPLYEAEESCHLIFEFKPKEIYIEQLSPSFDCGFGARAYAEGSFLKVSDEVIMEGEDR